MSCPEGKIGYTTKQDAWTAVQGLRHRHAPRSGQVRVYQCTACKQFHLTSRTDRVRIRG